MVRYGLEHFRAKSILMLQGPVGPFFKNLSDDLVRHGATVQKVNFNGGDRHFYPGGIDYRGTLDTWPDFLKTLFEQHTYDFVFLFGDCRKYHRAVHSAVSGYPEVTIGVFEEGYVRPDYITFEAFGVNGFSRIPKERSFYMSLSEAEVSIKPTIPVGNTFWYAAWAAIVYYGFGALYGWRFPHYKHHRPFNIWEAFYWLRSFWRKGTYRRAERHVEPFLLNEAKKSYFLVPLQIATDAQIVEHSTYEGIKPFIDEVIRSFADHAPEGTLLVIKHHPLDRGYRNYKRHIDAVAKPLGVASRVYYIHDQHLPALLEQSLGVVVINSTVGLSAIYHNAPVKVCGTAVYDFEGLTFQGSLDAFWSAAEHCRVDEELYRRFIGYVVNEKEINGNFYKALEASPNRSGIIW